MIYTEKELYDIWVRISKDDKMERLKIFFQLSGLDIKTCVMYNKKFTEKYRTDAYNNSHPLEQSKIKI